MATEAEIRKLAALARITVRDDELSTFTKEFDAIIAYVGQLERLDTKTVDDDLPLLRNVMRRDGEPHRGGEYTEALTGQFPAKEGDALSVKQIVKHE